MFRYLFKWRLIHQIYEITKLLQNEPIFSEFDLQFALIKYLKKYVEDFRSKSTCIWQIEFFNCFYLGVKGVNIKKYYPDLLILINNKLAYIVELKFFRSGRSFDEVEINHDLDKLDNLLSCLNENIDNNDNKVIGLEFIIDAERDNTDKVLTLLSNRKSTIFFNEKEQGEIFFSALIYQNISLYENRMITKEISEIKKKLQYL